MVSISGSIAIFKIREAYLSHDQVNILALKTFFIDILAIVLLLLFLLLGDVSSTLAFVVGGSSGSQVSLNV